MFLLENLVVCYAKMDMPSRYNPVPTIGLLVNSTEDKYENAILRGLFDSIQPRGANLVCFTSGALRSYHGFEAKRNILYNLVDTNQLDGLVISGTLGHNISQKEMAQLCYRYRPLPMVGIALSVPGIPGLMADSLDGMRRVIDHLIEAHGHRRIGFVRGPVGQREADERYRAYRKSLAAHQIPFDPKLVVTGDYTRSSGIIAVRRLLSQTGGQLTALACANDSMAIGALETFKSEGLDVPNDIALTGFDDTDDAHYQRIPLTSVRQSAYEQGYRAGIMLFEMMTGQSFPDLNVAPVKLVLRRSCGCGLARPRVVATALNADPTPGPVSLASHRDQMLVTVNQIATLLTKGLAPDAGAMLFDALSAELEDTASEPFLKTWTTLLEKEHLAGDETVWQDILAALEQISRPAWENSPISAHFDLTWERARLAVYEVSTRQHAELRIRAERLTTSLRELGETMVTTFNMDSLLSVMAQHLPALGVRACYLSLYADPQNPAEQSTLILAYDGSLRIDLPPSGESFSSPELVPAGRLFSRRKGSLVVEALYSKQSQLGFVVLEVAPDQAAMCATLRGLLSSALQGILLIQQRKSVEEELRSYQNTLEEMVIERTRDLVESNVNLQREMVERQQAEETIRQYADIVNSMQVGMYIVRAENIYDDTSLRVIAANPAALHYSEKTAEEVIGLRMDDVFKSLRGKGFPQKYLEVIQTGKSASLEDYYNDENGILQEAYSVKVFPLTADSVGVLFENVYEQKLAEIRLRQFNADLEARVRERTSQLEAANKELEAFSYSVSHDLRAPLRTISGYSSILLNDFSEEMPGQARVFVTRIVDGARQMGNLIDDLLSFSRTSRAEIRKQAINMDEMVREVWQDVVLTFPPHDVEFVCGSLPACRADRSLLRQVLVNLLSNAIKYSQHRRPAHIEVGCLAAEGEVAYFVRDNGAGFDMQYAGKLFGVFQRLHRSDEFEGTGIGLAVAHRIVARHNGRIWAHGEVNQGATFYFTLGGD